MTREKAETEINNYGYTISEQNKIIDDIYDYFEKEKQQLIKGQNLLIKAHEGYIEDVMNRTCGNCKWCKDEVCCNDESPLCADFVSEDFGCNRWGS